MENRNQFPIFGCTWSLRELSRLALSLLPNKKDKELYLPGEDPGPEPEPEVPITGLAFAEDGIDFVFTDTDNYYFPTLIKTPSNGTGNIIWESENPDIVSCSPTGTDWEVSKPGSARIIAHLEGNETVRTYIWITVDMPIPVQVINQYPPFLDGSLVMAPGETLQMNPQVLPEDATKKKLSYQKADAEDIGFDVTEDGLVTIEIGKTSGTYDVIAKSTDGSNVSATFKIGPTSFDFSDSPFKTPFPTVSRTLQPTLVLIFKIVGNTPTPIPVSRISDSAKGELWDYVSPMTVTPEGEYSVPVKIRSSAPASWGRYEMKVMTEDNSNTDPSFIPYSFFVLVQE